MKVILATLVLAAPLTASAVGRSVSNQAVVRPAQAVRIDAGKGELRVMVSSDQAFSYDVEFVPEGPRTFLGLGFGSVPPTEEELAQSKAEFDASAGILTVKAPKRLNAVINARVPMGNPLTVRMAAGKVKFGPRAGELDAKLDVGTLEYDASNLPKGACVDALVKTGAVNNRLDKDCTKNAARLRVDVGTIEVN